jgi:hypothetical protein
MTLVGLVDAVDTYAAHLCRWPARISCHRQVAVWWIVPVGYGVMTVAGVTALAAWAFTGRNAVAAWLTPGWAVGFLWLVMAMGPRKFGLDDLVVVGLAGGLAIEVLRKMAVDWFPRHRPLLRGLATGAWVLYGGFLFAVPFILAWAAQRSGLT